MNGRRPKVRGVSSLSLAPGTEWIDECSLQLWEMCSSTPDPRWKGNEQILRDFVASSSRPTLITNLSGQGPSTSVNGQSSAMTQKVLGSMLFLSRCAASTSWAMYLRRTRSRLSTSLRTLMKGKEKDGGPSE